MSNVQTNYTIHIETLGCKVNQIESESIARCFSDFGYLCKMGGISSKTEKLDSVLVSIINTCTVTAKAEQKARRLIRLLLDKYQNGIVIVTGCYAELDKIDIEKMDERICVVKGTQKDLLAKYPPFLQTIEIYSTQEKVAHTNSFFNALQKKISLTTAKRSFVLSTDTFMQHSRPSIKIQDGCNLRCSYCRICLARGESFSLDHNEVLERIKVLEKAKNVEVVITGINLALYHSGGLNFARLMKFLLDNTNTINFRLSSLHPQIVNEELCEILHHNRIRPHFHLSIQSGSDAILKKMSRPYNAESITTAIKRLREIKPHAFFACDIIAGFPSETDDDFNETKRIMTENNLTWIHAFPYSPRPETVANEMTPRVPQNISNDRVKVLTEIAINNKKSYIESCIGKTYTGIVEKYRKNDIHIVTENFLHVKVDPATVSANLENIGGKEVLVEILSVNEEKLVQAVGEAIGKIVSIHG